MLTNIQREDIQVLLHDLSYNGPLQYTALMDGFTVQTLAYDQRPYGRFRYAFEYLRDNGYIEYGTLPYGTRVWSINAGKLASVIQSRSAG